MIRSRLSVGVALVAAAALAVAGCSSQGGKQQSSDTGTGATAPMTVAMITHAQPGDTFWDLVRQGAKDAAAKCNVKLVYSSDPSASQQATLVQVFQQRRHRLVGRRQQCVRQQPEKEEVRPATERNARFSSGPCPTT